MTKYDPLGRYLQRQAGRGPICDLSFSDIERILGALLPKSAERPEWWSEHDPPAIQQAAWEAAGFEATLVVGKERVRFSRRI